MYRHKKYISMKINLNTQRTLSLIYQLRYLSYAAFKSFYIFFLLRWSVYWLYSILCLCTLTNEEKKSILLYYLIIFSSRLFTQTLLLHLLWFFLCFIFIFLFYEEHKKFHPFHFSFFIHKILGTDSLNLFRSI